MTITHDPNDPVGPGEAVLNDPSQYDVATQIDRNTGHPYVNNPGDLGHVIWGPISRYKNAGTGQQLFGPKRVGTPIFTGGKSASGEPTIAR
ncbi:MAG: hypothetical protein ABJN14_08520 [Paracoccaceae bacterium]